MGSSAAYIRAHEAIGRICRGGLDPRELRLQALAAIRRAVGFDAYAWLVTDPETAVDPRRWPTFPACRGCRS
jgi:hypothetical protein